MEKEIGVSLGGVLELEVLAGSAVLAGAGGLGRMVTSVNVMEVPDIMDWVSSGQLLITTAYSLKQDVSALLELIPKLDDARVAGLGIKLRRYVEEVPAEVLAVADRLNFPIFEIPHEISFSDIISAVLTVVMNRQTKVLQEIHNLHQSLTTTMLSGGDLRDIGNILYQRFGNSVAINSDFLSSFVIQTSQDKYDRIYQILQDDKRARRLEGHVEGASGAYRVENETLGDVCCERIIVPIYSDQILYGHIYIWEDHHRVNSLELSAIESVTSLIALEIMEKLSIIEMENNHKSGFLEDLLSADSRRQQKALGKARFYNFNQQNAHQVIVLRHRRGKQGLGAAGKAMFRVNTSVIGILQQLVKRTALKILYVNNDSSVVILCEVPSDDGKDLAEFLDNLAEGLSREFLANQVIIGVGRRYEKVSDLYRSFGEARRATACAHAAEGNIVVYERAGINRILAFDSIQNECELFRDEMLGKLLAYDRDKDSELVRTLAAYFRCKGNLTRLAEDLGVHYNTIVYRLQRIQDLTGFSLDSEQDLLHLQIALKIHEMQTNE